MSAIQTSNTISTSEYFASPEDSWPSLILEMTRVVRSPFENKWRSIHLPDGADLNSEYASIIFDVHPKGIWAPCESFLRVRGQVWLARVEAPGANSYDNFEPRLNNTIFAPYFFLQRIDDFKAYLNGEKIMDTNNFYETLMLNHLMGCSSTRYKEKNFNEGWTINTRSPTDFPGEENPYTTDAAKAPHLNWDHWDYDNYLAQSAHLNANVANIPVGNTPAGIWSLFEAQVNLTIIMPTLDMDYAFPAQLQLEFNNKAITRGIYASEGAIPGNFAPQPAIIMNEMTIELQNLRLSTMAKSFLEKQLNAGKGIEKIVPTYQTNVWDIPAGIMQLNKILFTARPQTAVVIFSFKISNHNDGKHRVERKLIPNIKNFRVLHGSTYKPQQKQNFDPALSLYHRMYQDTDSVCQLLNGNSLCFDYAEWTVNPFCLAVDLTDDDAMTTNPMPVSVEMDFSVATPANLQMVTTYVDRDKIKMSVGGAGGSASLQRIVLA